ncbi:MAG: leucyl/phenylalanyl-tRNA--protein transferase [Gemmataceae bacterium]|nr:leucyl/phenylalanyl-tRNA--protein transferase [Gemmataceae bacterium]
MFWFRRRKFNPELLDPSRADAMGLVAVGGDLRPEWLLQAYRRGVFPWYAEGEAVHWWSPDPRAILELDGFHVPRRLARTLRSRRFRATVNTAFGAVIRGCAAGRDEGTWITPEIIAAYEGLHQLGHAHSVEAWHGEHLAGGVYGVVAGGLFAAESMFTRIRDGSKVALAALVERVRQRGFTLVDVQMLTEHTARLGAIEIPRAEYLRRLRAALGLDVTFA